MSSDNPRAQREFTSEELLGLLDNSLPIMIYELDTLKFIAVNDSAVRKYGYSRDDFMDMTVKDIHASTEQESTKARSARNELGRWHHRLKSGAVIDIESTSRTLTYEGRRAVLMTVHDLADDNLSGGSLKEDEQLFKRMFDDNTLAMILYEPESGHIIDANRSAIRFYGYTRQKFLSLRVQDIAAIPPEDFFAKLLDMVTKGFNNRIKASHRLASGEVREVEVHTTPIAIAGKLVNFSIICDISSQSQSVKTPLADESMYRNLIQSMPNGYYRTDHDDALIEVNSAFASMTGYSSEELLSMKNTEALHFNRSEYEAKLKSLNEQSGTKTYRLKKKDGSEVWVEDYRQYVLGHGEKASYFEGICRDVTGNRQAAEAFDQYKLLFKNSADIILYIRYNDRRIIEANKVAEIAYGYTRQELLSRTIYDIRTPQTWDSIPRELNDAISDKIVFKSTHRRKDGSSFPVEIRSQGLSISGDQVLISVVRDFSESEHAREVVKEAEAHLRQSLEDSPIAFQCIDNRGKILDVNKSWLTLLGYHKDEVVGHLIFELVPPEDAHSLQDLLTNPKASEEIHNAEFTLLKKGGERVTVVLEGRIDRDSDGNIQQARCAIYNITQRKLAENSLKDSEQTFRLLAKNASTAVFIYQKDRIRFVNAACCAITGYRETDLVGKNFWEIVHPDFRGLTKQLGAARQRGENVPTHYEVKILPRFGDPRWMDFTAAIIDYQGESAVLGTAYDITDRKIASQRLEESEERYRNLVDQSPDAIMVCTDGQIAYLNSAAVGLMHAGSHEQLLGKQLQQFIHPNSLAMINAGLDETEKAFKPVEIHDEQCLRLDGTSVDVEIVSGPISYSGKPSAQIILRDVSDKKQAQEQLRLQSIALNTAANGILITDKNGAIAWANPAFERLTGYSLSEVIGKNPNEIIKSGKQDDEFYKNLWDTISKGKVWHGELVNRRKDGSLYTEDMAIAPVPDENGEVTHFVAVKQDITERKLLGEQALQTRKLESIGQLAGGVAHDFNNLLGVVLGYGELLKRRISSEDPVRKPVEAILSATKRGADLTRQLLTFAQKGMISPEAVNINSAIESAMGMLERILNENVILEFSPGKDLWDVIIDPAQVNQILVDLATNARDAIETAGSVTIKTSNVELDNEFVRDHFGFIPGQFVMMSFTDSGKGISKDMIDRVFEPFFTTKPEGKGTGLGLSTVYGIVKQNKGNIGVSSEPGAGTTFNIYLPRFSEDKVSAVEKLSEEAPKGSETILVVEDQGDLLELVKTSLEESGYEVLAAQGPNEALNLCKTYPGTIHLLLTDVIMPVMSGKEMSDKIIKMRPGIKTVFMSGYTANVLAPHGVLNKGINFLQKPFTFEELAEKVHAVLSS